MRGSDELIGLGWSESSLAASHWFDEPGPWVIEGVVVARALRKWLTRHPVGKPCDLALWLNMPVVARTSGQHIMALGCETVWNEILPDLRDRGVHVIELR